MKKILLILTLTTLIFACKKEEGCTDVIATNYNADAEKDDGSCTYTEGCTDTTAANYNPLATIDDASCIPFVYGCMDTTAFNFDTLATVDDGSCEYLPSALKLSSITINAMPMTHNNGETWDWDITGLTSGPDVFYVLKQGGAEIAVSSSQDNISTFPISFTEGLPYTINNLSQEYTIELYDNDQIAGVGENELIGSCSFIPNASITTGGSDPDVFDEINITMNGIVWTLNIQWIQ